MPQFDFNLDLSNDTDKLISEENKQDIWNKSQKKLSGQSPLRSHYFLESISQ